MEWLKLHWIKIAIAAGLLALALFFIPKDAHAADLGGNCCADLEERIAELEATTARKGNRKVSLEVYGQINAALLHVETEGFEDTAVVQNGADESFFGVRGSAKINSDMSAGYVLEIDLRQLGLLDSGVGNTPETEVRQSYFYLQSEALGRVSLGRAGQATQDFDRISTATMSMLAKPNSLQPLSDAYLTGLDLPYDGTYRNVVRYDSPSLAGFRLSASWGDASSTAPDGNGDAYDIALRYAGEFSGFKVAAGAGWRHDEDLVVNILGITTIAIPTGDVETILASGSVMHAQSGIFLSGYYADQDWKDALGGFTLKSWHLQGGIEQKMFTSLGDTTIFGEYGETDLGGAADLPVYGLGLVQSIDAAALDLYLHWRQYDADDVLGDSVDVVTTGARIKF